MESIHSKDDRIHAYLTATVQMKQGDFEVDLPLSPEDEISQLGRALMDLGKTLEERYHDLKMVDEISAQVNTGLLLDEILDNIYDTFKNYIPYNRIGFSLLENENKILRAYWARNDTAQTLILKKGYSASMEGSSLQKILESGKPRLLNDLKLYLQDHPASESTRMVVEEGVRSSLTCPLVANGIPVGFMFFSSSQTNTYDERHVEIYQRIANQLSVMVEKGRLVSALANQKAEIEAKNVELQRLDELKNRFMGIAAHDLRSPLATIQMVSAMLMGDPASFKTEEMVLFLGDIHSQSQHMLALLNDLLDMTRIQAGKLNLEPIWFDLRLFMEDTVERHARLASTKQTKVVLISVVDGKIYADPLRMRQVLDNLISNAVKYSPRGSVVKIDVERDEPGWRLMVHDEGPGINAEEGGRLFQEFSRLSARPTGGESSTGLGLAITRRVVEAHGGKIGVKDGPGGKGSTFWVWLPDGN